MRAVKFGDDDTDRLSRPLWKGFAMSDLDLSAQFQTISDQARLATEKIKAANHQASDQLQADVAGARDKAGAAADHLNDKAVAARHKRTSDWDQIRDDWQAHVAKARAHVKAKKAQLNADDAAAVADMDEVDALDAIEFAAAAIDEAAYVALNAIETRAYADSLNAKL